jgi:methyl-accepting chemotaxis protein
MNAIAGGDLSVDIDSLDRKDEIGGMARALQVFKDAAIDKLQHLAKQEVEKRASDDEKRRAEQDAIDSERAIVVSSIGAGLGRLAARDLTCRLNDSLPEAYRQLQADFNATAQELERAMGEVVGGSRSIGSTAGEISSAADDLARRTERQAATLEETSAAMNELLATVRSTAENVTSVSEIVRAAKSDARSSKAEVEQAIAAMGLIDQSSREVGQIIGVIDEIAFQTNLLALNAGVEAARAGDAGRGFAVVASEVRALAQRSAEAAKEIKSLVSSSASHVAQGVKLVGGAGAALQRIAEQVNKIDALVVDVASAAREQATTVTEVNKAVSEMDQATQQNAAMVEETSAATQHLNREANELTLLVDQFSITGSKGRNIYGNADRGAKVGFAPERAA